MNLSGFPYGASPRVATNPPPARSHQSTASHMGLGMPVFSTHMTAPVPYQPGTFPFDPLSVNPYNMQQAYSIAYSSSLPQHVSYAGMDEVRISPVRGAQNDFVLERSPPVKAESASPVLGHQAHSEPDTGERKRSSSELGESGQVNFATDVDTLMKAIQANQKPPFRAELPKVLEYRVHAPVRMLTSLPSQRMPRTPSRDRKSDTNAPWRAARRPFIRRRIERFTCVLILASSLS